MLGITPLSKIEIVSMVNINNMGYCWIYYDLADRTQKYNPTVYAGYHITIASHWNIEEKTTYSSWPES